MDASLDDIALFVEVARRKNFSRAAESSGVPVSTLSRRISELERYIGVKLFRRSTRKVELTEAGGFISNAANISSPRRVSPTNNCSKSPNSPRAASGYRCQPVRTYFSCTRKRVVSGKGG